MNSVGLSLGCSLEHRMYHVCTISYAPMQFSSRIVTEKNIVAVMGAFRTTLVVTRLPPTHLRFERAFQHCRQPMFLQDCNNVCMRQTTRSGLYCKCTECKPHLPPRKSKPDITSNTFLDKENMHNLMQITN